MRLTLKDLARELGVSTATVSNAFSRPDQLSAELRERILSEAKRLGYQGPNATARSLRRGETGIIGLVLADRLQYNFEDPVATRFLHGVSEVFDERNINMLLLPSRTEFYLDQSFDSLADGYIIYGPPRDKRILERIVGRRKPALTVDFNLPSVSSLNIDNETGAYLAASHGLRQVNPPVAILGLRLIPDADGIERITDQTMAGRDESVSRRRLDGYQRAFDEQRISPADVSLWNAPESRYELGYQAAREALRLEQRPRLLLCMSDRLALGAIAAAQDMGLSIPDDLKVIGFDDIPTAAFQRPALTTIHQPQHEKGRRAAQMILDTDAPQHDEFLDARLVVRDSC